MVQTGAVTLIQCFGGVLNLNIHFHMLFLDGAYTGGSKGHPLMFRKVKVATKDELASGTRICHHAPRVLGVRESGSRGGRWCAQLTALGAGMGLDLAMQDVCGAIDMSAPISLATRVSSRPFYCNMIRIMQRP